MQDDLIVDLYWKRDETAIKETELKYGHYLLKIAYNILFDSEDSKESVNDTYLKAWKSIPPHKPQILSTYLGKIVRQVSIDIFRKRTTEKRQASEYAVSLSELDECISCGNITEQYVDLHLLGKAISDFLRTLPPEARNTFVARYFFADTIREIASYYDMSDTKVKSMLHRTRIKLKSYLKQEGFIDEIRKY